MRLHQIVLYLAVLFAAAAPARLTAEGRRAVWIDADPACGTGVRADVDDCWAIIAALAAPALSVRGISTVFGNRPGAATHATASRLLALLSHPTPPLFRGADGPTATPTAASEALIAALERERLTILALGPLTNIAAALKARPELASRIDRIVAVAGRRPGETLQAGHNPLAHFHDVNFRADPGAFETILTGQIALVLIPFAAAKSLPIRGDDLVELAASTRAAALAIAPAKNWLEFWRLWFVHDGFLPFDLVAAGYLIWPELYDCQDALARIDTRKFGRWYRRDDLIMIAGAIIANAGADGTVADRRLLYCDGVSPATRKRLLELVKQGVRGNDQ